MRRPLLSLVALALLAAAPSGCRDDGGEADGAEAPHREGEVRFADRRLEIVPFVAHSREMDLRDQCRAARDVARDAGADDRPPLCFDPHERSAVGHVRIEHLPGLRGGQATQLLAAEHEGAHFLVEASGGITQVLDLAYAPRRDGAYRPDEIRVLSGDEAAHERLVEALKEHFPELNVRVVRPVEEEGEGPADGG